MKMKKISVALLAAMSLASASAFADSYSVTMSGTPSGATDLSSAVSFAGFNSSLGTLNSVTISLSADVVGTVNVANWSASAKTGTVSLDALLGFGTGSVASTFYTGNVYTQSYSLASGDSVDLGGVKTVAGSVSYSTGLAYFLTSSVTGTAGVKALSHSVGGEDVDTWFITSALSSGTVTYNYTAAVPEPETYGMLLAGLGLVGAIARRKNARRQA
jgi:hypothetical protein